MKKNENINYLNSGSEWHLGDLLLPDGPGPYPMALCIHGGGWSDLDRSSFDGVAEFLCAHGFATFNIEYRLLGTAPWPACGDDCLAAALFLLSGGDHMPNLKRDKLFIIGGSSGGHLALMTGLRLPRDKVYGIVSISGIADTEYDRCQFPDRYTHFWRHEPTTEDFKSSSPLYWITAKQPPILCTHCPLDNVVDIASPQKFIKQCQESGADAELLEYTHPRETCKSHCIWIPGSYPQKLYPEIENSVIQFAYRVIC
jgi:acetyl esterase/lipase